MESLLNQELQKFNSFKSQVHEGFDLIEVGPSILKLTPKTDDFNPAFRLGLLALVHGNEIVGLPVLNGILGKIVSGHLKPNFEIYFGLGNLPAAFANKRFLETDLNRSFGKNSDATIETRRAKELETLMLNHCDYVLDLHQTVSPTRHSFFIFEYSKGLNLSFLKQINPGLPTIVQFEAIGDESGLSSDEYTLRRGKFGTALELGQKGFSEEQCELGLKICSRAIEVLNSPVELEKSRPWGSFSFYQLGERCRAPQVGSALNPGWENFMEIKKGQVVGLSDGQPILSPETGYVLFPKSVPAQSAGQELFYICTPFQAKENQIFEAAIQAK